MANNSLLGYLTARAKMQHVSCVFREQKSIQVIKEKNQHGPKKEMTTMKMNFVLKIVNMQGPFTADGF